MTGPLRTLDISVPHSRSIDTAWNLVITWLANNKTDGVKPLATNFDHANHRATLVLDAWGTRVDATVTVTASHVDVSSETIDGFFLVVAIGTETAESRISSQLTELLR